MAAAAGWVKVIVSIASNGQWPLSSDQVGWVKVIVSIASNDQWPLQQRPGGMGKGHCVHSQ